MDQSNETPEMVVMAMDETEITDLLADLGLSADARTVGLLRTYIQQFGALEPALRTLHAIDRIRAA